MPSCILIPTLAATLITAVASQAAVIHNESIHGDLSGSFAGPTSLSFMPGANTIIAQMGNNGNTGATLSSRDADYFTVTIGPEQAIGSITVDTFTFSPNNPGVSFAAYVAAAAFAGQEEEDIAGSAFIDAASGDILDNFTGSTAPLGPGVYSFWFQETSANTVNYQVTFNIVPEPSTTLLGLSSALFGLGKRRRGR